MQPDEPSDEERLEQLPEDYDTPFRPADDTGSTVPDDHPSTDTDVDLQELYDTGLPADERSGEQPSQAYPLEPTDDSEE